MGAGANLLCGEAARIHVTIYHNQTKERGREEMENRNREGSMQEYREGKWNIGSGGSLPIGFGLSLAANEKSKEAFSAMSEAQKEATVEKARQMHTRADMESFVNSLGKTL